MQIGDLLNKLDDRIDDVRNERQSLLGKAKRLAKEHAMRVPIKSGPDRRYSVLVWESDVERDLYKGLEAAANKLDRKLKEMRQVRKDLAATAVRATELAFL